MNGNLYVADMLDKLQKKAMADEELRKRLFESRNAEFPLRDFCSICREQGFEIYPMDVIAASEEFYAEKKRSTNGGGENSPVLEGEDDLYEDFFALLER